MRSLRHWMKKSDNRRKILTHNNDACILMRLIDPQGND